MLQHVNFDLSGKRNLEHTKHYESFVYRLLQRLSQVTVNHNNVSVKRMRCSADIFQRIVSANARFPIIRVEQFSQPIHGNKMGRICGVLVYEHPEAKSLEVEYTKLPEELEGVHYVTYGAPMDSGPIY